MKVETKNRYSDAKIYQVPPCEPIPKDTFIKYLKDGVNFLYGHRSRDIINLKNSQVNILKGYLDFYKIEQIIPDEEFFDLLWKRTKESLKLNGKTYSEHTRKKIGRSIRMIVNEYLYDKLGILKRRILREVEIQRYERFFQLTKKSQEAIIWFENNGKIVRAIPVIVNGNGSDNLDESDIKFVKRITNRSLLTNTNYTKVQMAMLFLRVIGKDGFEKVDKQDVKKFEEYCDTKQIKKKEDYLADTATFFANIKQAGFIKGNPFSHIPLKKNSRTTRREFISQTGINKLLDLSTVDFNNRRDVRDRLIILLMYDLAIRTRECLFLECSDVGIDSDGSIYVLLRTETQKGRKPEEVQYLFFEQTKKLLKHYINNVRKEFHPRCDCLFISDYGTRLCDQRYRRNFDKICEKFNIKTFYGNKPTPHCLRHSFATLNVEPIGLALPLYEIKRRMRHSKYETLEFHYVHNNPILNKEKFNKIATRTAKKNFQDFLDEVPLVELEYWLSEKLGLDIKTIKIIRRKHQSIFDHKDIDKNSSKDIINEVYLTEEETIARIEHLRIPLRSLRKYAINNGFALNGNGQFRYREDIIDDLSRNWVTKQQAMQKLHLSRPTFFRVLKDKKWEKIRLGHTIILHKGSLI
jgi:site-specific recombinase XerD